MHAATARQEGLFPACIQPASGPPSSPADDRNAPDLAVSLPRAVAEAVWRADELGANVREVVPSGFPELDAELPGRGWPCGAVTELLQPQPGVLEWRLLAGALQRATATKALVVIGSPRPLFAAGLAQAGIDVGRLVWIRAETPAERLWCTEQLVKAGSAGAIVAWLPQARPEQIRRLQVCAQACTGPVFLCRPLAAQHEASAAPLRAAVAQGADWTIDVRLVKRRGPVHDSAVSLQAVPGTLASVLTPRVARPSLVRARIGSRAGDLDVVGSAAAAHGQRRTTVS